MRWTAEELSRLVELKKEGVPAAFIAERLGRTVASVNKVAWQAETKLARMRDPASQRYGRLWGRAEVADLRSRVEAGASLNDLARHYGCSNPAILYQLQKHGLETVREAGGARKYDYRRIGEMVDQGYSASAVARETGCNLSHARHLVRTLA